MNKNILSFLLLILALFNLNKANAVNVIPERVTTMAVSVNETDDESEETDIIKKVSFRDKFKRSPEVQITNFFKKYNRYSSKNEIEKLRNLYSASFINNDGFNKETIFKLMKMSADTYKEIKYSSDIQSIKVDGNYAVVNVHETAVGETSKPMPKVGDTGIIISDIYYTDYLRKEDNDWKILTSVINYEKVDLKYGEAKNINIDISAPDYVSSSTQYEVNVKANIPPEVFSVGSIVNEQITFPQKDETDTFKALKNDELTRLVYANKDNKNEYATVSLALTRAKVEPDTLVLNMTGMAFVMKRVNVIRVNEIKIDEEKQDAQEAEK